jgi:hypothetical protein
MVIKNISNKNKIGEHKKRLKKRKTRKHKKTPIIYIHSNSDSQTKNGYSPSFYSIDFPSHTHDGLISPKIRYGEHISYPIFEESPYKGNVTKTEVVKNYKKIDGKVIENNMKITRNNDGNEIVEEYIYPTDLNDSSNLKLCEDNISDVCQVKSKNIPLLKSEEFSIISHFPSPATENLSSHALRSNEARNYGENISSENIRQFSNFPSSDTENWSSPTLRSGESLNLSSPNMKSFDSIKDTQGLSVAKRRRRPNFRSMRRKIRKSKVLSIKPKKKIS